MDNIFDTPDIVEKYAKGEFRDTTPAEGEPDSMPRLAYFINYILDKAPRFRTVLDIGCATANLGGVLARVRKDLNYAGMDISLPMLQRARETHGDLRLAVGDAMRLPFKPNSVPYVICASTLWYCEDPAAALEAAYRVASRVLMAEIIFTPHVEEGTVATQVVSGHEQKVRLLGSLELQHLLERIHEIQPFKELRDNNRFMHIRYVNDRIGLHEIGDLQVHSLMAIFEKRISASLIDIFNAQVGAQNTEQTEPAAETEEE